MVYGNKNSKRNYKRKSNGLTLSKVKKMVEKTINKKAELKSVDVTHASANPTVLVPLQRYDYLEVAQGDTGLTRDGQEITARNISIRSHLTASDGDAVRIVWVWIAGDTMDAGLIADFAALTYNGFLPRYQDQHYTVLSDKVYLMNMSASSEIQHKDIKFNFNLKNKKIVYSGSASTIERGELSCHIYVRDNSSISISYNDKCRFNFYDM